MNHPAFSEISMNLKGIPSSAEPNLRKTFSDQNTAAALRPSRITSLDLKKRGSTLKHDTENRRRKLARFFYISLPPIEALQMVG
jgi:hypothetical protein